MAVTQPERDGLLPERTPAASRGTLATRARAGYHGARHRRAAAAVLDTVLVGPGAGGRRLSAFAPISTGRSLAVCLHHALYAVREAIDYRRATGGMHAFDTAVAAGVSHELTESLVALVGGSEGARLGVARASAAGVAEGCAAAGEPVGFSPATCPPCARPACATGARSRPSPYGSPAPSYGRTGPRLAARAWSGCGCSPGRRPATSGSRSARRTYRTAGHAHLLGPPVRLRGRLESRGGFRRLTDLTELVPVQVGEAEKDRLLKALQANAGTAAFFGEACGPDDGP